MNRIILALLLPLLLSVQAACEREDPMLTLAKAIDRGDLKALEKAMQRGVSPDSMEEGVPLIVIAIEGRGGINAAKILLKSGADINATGPHSDTALMSMSGRGSVEGVKFMLENGADPNIESAADGSTALSLVTVNGDGSDALAILRMLVAAGADPCHKNHKGMRAQQNPPGYAPGLLGRYIDEECRKRGGG